MDLTVLTRSLPNERMGRAAGCTSTNLTGTIRALESENRESITGAVSEGEQVAGAGGGGPAALAIVHERGACERNARLRTHGGAGR